MKPIHIIAAAVAALIAIVSLPTGAAATADLSVCQEGCLLALRACKGICRPGSTEPFCRVPCPEQYARCLTRCATPQDDTCELKCNQGEDACRRTRPAETCQKEAAACRERCASYGPDPIPW